MAFIERQLEKCWAHIDKLMLFWLLVLGIGAAVYLQTRGNMDEGTLDWTRGLSTNILSGLLGLLGGASMASRILHNAGSDKPPTTPPSSDPKP